MNKAFNLESTHVSIAPADNRVMILSDYLGKPMIRINGVWKIGIFVPDDLKDNFESINNISRNVEILFYEALLSVISMN